MKTFSKISALGVMAAAMLAGFSGEANATYSCSNSTYGAGTDTIYTNSNCSANNTANQASTVATAATVLRTATTQTANMVTGRISNALGGGASGFKVASNGFSASGMAGGDADGKLGVWINGSWAGVEDNNTSTAYEGDIYTGVAGIDYRITPKAVIGLALGYEDVDIDTEYNGFNGTDGNIDGDGYTIAPYIGYQLTDKISADLTAGYSSIDYDTLRYDPVTGNAITGSTDADRYFVNASINADYYFRNTNWRLRSKGSVFYANEEKDAYTETETTGATVAVAEEETELGQILIDERLGYTFKNVEPYALVGLEFDYTDDEAPVAAGQTTNDDDFGAKFGAGMDFQLGPNLTGGIEAYTVEFREDYDEYAVTGGLRLQF